MATYFCFCTLIVFNFLLIFVSGNEAERPWYENLPAVAMGMSLKKFN